VGAQGEPDRPPRVQIQDHREVERSLAARDLIGRRATTVGRISFYGV
jgi:hypothetical protein